MNIKIANKQSIKSFEKIISENYKLSLSENSVYFDISKLKYIDPFPASLLFSWILELLTNQKIFRVELILPDKKDITKNIENELFDSGLLSLLKEIGALLIFSPTEYQKNTIRYKMLESQDRLWEKLQNEQLDFTKKISIHEPESDIIASIYEIGIYEIIENIFNHADGKNPYYSVSHKISTQLSDNHDDSITPFKPGTPYLEIIIGDLGDGINSKLNKFVKPDYIPPFSTYKVFLKNEKTLAYAFEFLSTSDENARKQRIEKLLISDEIKPSDIATGLFCVSEITRIHQGQLIIRTPSSILSIDYHKRPGISVVLGKKELNIKTITPLKGTHYLIRVPLTTKSAPESTSQTLIFSGTPSIKALQPFKSCKQLQSPSACIQSAYENIETHLSKNRAHKGITVIMPPTVPLMSREISVFLAGIRAMIHGMQLLVWCNSKADIVYNKSWRSSTVADYYIKGSPVLIGDLHTNQFKMAGDIGEKQISWIKKNDTESNLYHFNDEILESIENEYYKYTLHQCKKYLQSPEVIHSHGPFLIEGQYYTTKYYEIPKALDTNIKLKSFAELCIKKINLNKVEILIAASSILTPLVDEMASIIKLSGGNVFTLTFETPYKPATILSESLPYFQKNCTIITDVICRANSINDLLSYVHGMNIHNILTLVDSRDKRSIRKPIQYESMNGSTLIPVYSIHEDSIAFHKDPPRLTNHNFQEDADILDENVFVIDRKTRAPALYVRPARPTKTFKAVLYEQALSANALFTGHSEYANKHYSFFLHIPRLFETLRSEIKTWMKNQVEFIETTSPEQNHPWSAYIYNPKGNLTWSENAIDLLPDMSSVDVITKEQLYAPKPPSQAKSNKNILILLPAIASGETARLCIEFASREQPSNILLLCFMSRMDPHHQTFFSGITVYRNSQLHVAFFLDFPIGAYERLNGSCPLCRDLEMHEHSLKMVDENANLLTNALKEKIAIIKPTILHYGEKGMLVRNTITKSDIERAYIRALYGSSIYNLKNRYELNNLLDRSDHYIDIFLEILSLEYLSNIFEEKLLKKIFYKVLPKILNRLHKILDEESPPFPVGRFTNALIHLVPNAFVGTAINLVQRFASSYRDIEAICLALIRINIKPNMSTDIISYCRIKNYLNTGNLLQETLDFLSIINDKENTSSKQSVIILAELWSRLSRSSYFESIDKVRNILTNAPCDYSDVKSNMDYLLYGWKSEITKLISKIFIAPIWRHLAERKPDIGQGLTLLDKYIVYLDHYWKNIEGNQTLNEKETAELLERVTQIISIKTKLSESIYSLFINPCLCEASVLPEKLIAHDGSRLNFTKEIDQYVPRVFCDMSDLNQLCSQITINWQKHAQIGNKPEYEVWFKIYTLESFVCLEFGDNIEGDFNFRSEGGLRIVKEVCSAYGCKIDTNNHSGDTKSIKILLPTCSLDLPAQPTTTPQNNHDSIQKK